MLIDLFSIVATLSTLALATTLPDDSSTLIGSNTLAVVSAAVDTDFPTSISTTSTFTSTSSTSTYMQPLTTSYVPSLPTSGQFDNLSTSGLPFLKLFQRQELYYDYIFEVGQPEQQLPMRLDVLQGDMWLPAKADFPTCAASSVTRLTTTILPRSTDLNLPPNSAAHEDPTTTTTPTNSNTSSSSSTSSTVSSLTVDMLNSVHVQACSGSGVYDILNSVSGHFIDLSSQLVVGFKDATQYSLTYMSSIFTSGTWAIDNFIWTYNIAGSVEVVEFSNVPFVYANFSNVGVGALALGSSQSDYSYQHNFLSNFVDNGIINNNGYSLALGASNSSAPQLILGGVKRSFIKQTIPSPQTENDDLMALFDFVPVLDETQEYIPLNDGISYSVPAFPIFGWGVTSGKSKQSITFSPSYNDRYSVSGYPKPALIDSRHAYNYIPYSTLVEMAVELNAFYSADLDRWIVDCSVQESGTINVLLGGYTIQMPIGNFLYPASSNNTNLVFTSGNPACYLAFLPDYRLGYSLMATPFLKSVYMAIDNENGQIALSGLKDQLEDLGIDINTVTYSSGKLLERDVEPETDPLDKRDESTSTTFTIDNPYSETETELFTGSITELSSYSNTISIVQKTTMTVSSSTITTTMTYNPDPFFTASLKSNGLYEIANGTIPYAIKFTDVSSLTLTLPKTLVFTDSFDQKTEVYISDGEVYLQTDIQGGGILGPGGGGNGGNGNWGAPQTTETGEVVRVTQQTSTTIYAFSSLVSSISSHSMSAAGAHIQVPSIVHYAHAGASQSLTYLWCIVIFVVGIVVLV
jgi:hypothetical protein